MSDKPRINLFLYVVIAVLAVVIVALVFVRNFQKGEQIGAKTPKQEGATSETTAGTDLRALAKDEGLAAKGKTLFMTNCASCHGTKGYGDGNRAAGLNPPPRNYHTEKFKFGDDIVSIYNTLQKGSPGTSMPSFVLLPPDEVMAMAHYVRTLVPNPMPTTDAILAKLPEAKPGATASAPSPQSLMDSLFKDTGPRIPIQVAMQRIAQAPETPRYASRINSDKPGAELYARRCANCHGEFGEGKRLRLLSVAPYRYEASASLAGSHAEWTHSQQKFAEIVLRGITGRAMPGNGTLTPQQMADLYAFVRSLQER
jgi:mono/diheme cytochrome c family protein